MDGSFVCVFFLFSTIVRWSYRTELGFPHPGSRRRRGLRRESARTPATEEEAEEATAAQMEVAAVEEATAQMEAAAPEAEMVAGMAEAAERVVVAAPEELAPKR